MFKIYASILFEELSVVLGSDLFGIGESRRRGLIIPKETMSLHKNVEIVLPSGLESRSTRRSSVFFVEFDAEDEAMRRGSEEANDDEAMRLEGEEKRNLSLVLTKNQSNACEIAMRSSIQLLEIV